MSLRSIFHTILSGPAASVMGARYLSKATDIVVSDMGGTTTDIALLKDGWPALNSDGADVAGWRTMVQAVSVHTVGLGGDSEVSYDLAGGLLVGPRRSVPLCLLIHQHPQLLRILRSQWDRRSWKTHDGRFAMRLRPMDTSKDSLTTGEAKVWDALADGPKAVEKIMADHPLDRQLRRLVDRGLVIISGFSVCDASHILGAQTDWNRDAAELGARLWARTAKLDGYSSTDDPKEIAAWVFNQVEVQSATALVDAALLEEMGCRLTSSQTVANRLLAQSIGSGSAADSSMLNVSISLNRPIVAVGAPVKTFYPGIAKRLGATLCMPDNHHVANAVGAVSSGVVRRVKVLVTRPQEGCYRVHLAAGLADFSSAEAAIEHARCEVSTLALRAAEDAGAREPDLSTHQAERRVAGSGGHSIFIDCEVTATAVGQPRTVEV